MSRQKAIYCSYFSIIDDSGSMHLDRLISINKNVLNRSLIIDPLKYSLKKDLDNIRHAKILKYSWQND
jgi:hypothetical protein